jgi:hypothetical protein
MWINFEKLFSFVSNSFVSFLIEREEGKRKRCYHDDHYLLSNKLKSLFLPIFYYYCKSFIKYCHRHVSWVVICTRVGWKRQNFLPSSLIKFTYQKTLCLFDTNLFVIAIMLSTLLCCQLRRLSMRKFLLERDANLNRFFKIGETWGAFENLF